MSDPARVTANHIAETFDGRPVLPLSRRAARWCAVGALFAAGRCDPTELRWKPAVQLAFCCAQEAASRHARSSLPAALINGGPHAVLEIYRTAFQLAGMSMGESE